MLLLDVVFIPKIYAFPHLFHVYQQRPELSSSYVPRNKQPIGKKQPFLKIVHVCHT